MDLDSPTRQFCKPESCMLLALAAMLLHELLQQTPERNYMKLFVTPCSTAVRAQHIRRPRRVHGVLDPNNNSAKKSMLQRDIHYLRRMDSTWERLCLLQPSSKLCLPGPHIPPNGPKIEMFLPKTRIFGRAKKGFEICMVKNAKKGKKSPILRSPDPPKILEK